MAETGNTTRTQLINLEGLSAFLDESKKIFEPTLPAGTNGQVLKLSGGKPTWDTDNTPTAFKWTNGTTAGPTGSLTGNGMTAVSFAAIPSAGASASGVVTTGAQTFAGTKTFSSPITGSLNGNASTATAADKTAHSLSVKDGAATPVAAINSWNGSADKTLTIKGESPVTTTATDGTITITHATSGVTAGTYKSVTVDAKGHVTGGTNPSTLSGYGITDAKIASGVITLGSNTITPLTSASTLSASKVNGTLATSNIPNLDASKITSGTISVDRLPATALERCVVVADDTARFKLTTSSVQVGDTVKVTATKKMYMVIDSSKLSSESGYEEYFTSTDWSTITNKPSSYTPSSHTHTKSQITDFPPSMPASDVYAWAKAKNKPSYAWSEITNKPSTFTPANHTHNYAGSASAGGSATSSLSIAASQLTSATEVDGFLETNKLKYAIFTDYKNIGFVSDNGMIVSLPWSDDLYGTQVAVDDGFGVIKVRGKSSGTWGSWKQLWKEGDSITAPSITATTGFTGNLTGTASKATNDSAGQQITTTYIKGLSVSGKTITYTKGDGSTGTITTQDTTYSNKTAASGGTDVSLVTTGEKYTWNNKANAFTVSNGGSTASWGKSVTVGTVAGTALTFTMPANPNTDTHYTAKNVVASSSTGTANVTAATNNPYVNLIENGTVRSTHRISGSGATTVKTDTSGNIIISSTDTNTTYSNKTAASGGTEVSLVTTGEKYTWNSKANATHNHTKSQITDFPSSMPASDVYAWAKAKDKPSYAWSEITNKPSTFTPSTHTHSDATTSASGFMSSTDKAKLGGIAPGAEVNQNAFSNVTVGSTTISADSKTDTLTLTAGNNITLTPDAANDKITISSSYVAASASTSGIVTTETQTFAGAKTFSNTTDSTNNTSGAVIVSGGLGVAKNIYAAAVHNAVWNDLADCIPVDDECKVEPGYCYCFDGEKYYKSTKYLDEGIVGIDSDTYGMNMGHKPDLNQMDVAVAGFVLAYVDKEYKPGTPLTCTENGYLTEIKKEDKIEYPERIVATYWKSEPADEWGSDSRRVKVNGRKWVKVV